MSKHTPGPWRFKNGAIYATTLPDEDGKPNRTLALVRQLGEFKEVSDSNGQLMAMAPELLSQLIKARTWISKLAEFPEGFIEKIDVVIAKAKGES